MIQLEQVHIEHVRGIHSLTLELGRRSFAIHGPNGSGKSGVVDAIEFGLTGSMVRLSGRGTGSLSVKAHGPHVDARDYPDKARVSLRVHLTRINKTVTIERKLNSANAPSYTPDSKEIRAELHEVGNHPEFTLTRRQIAKFIVTEAGNRAKDVQALLRLEAIDQVRAALKSAQRTTSGNEKAARAAADSALDALRRHLDVEELETVEVLDAVNRRRVVLGAAPLEAWIVDTNLRQGLGKDSGNDKALDRSGAERDLEALRNLLEDEAGAKAAAALVDQVDKLLRDEATLLALQRRAFIEQGLSYADEGSCPLCDTTWELEELTAYLREKIRVADDAESIRDSINIKATELGTTITKLRKSIGDAAQIATRLEETASESVLEAWSSDMAEIQGALGTVDGLVGRVEQFRTDWSATSEVRRAALDVLSTKIAALPDVSDKEEASSFLVLAEERQLRLRQAQREVSKKAAAAKAAAAAHNAYSDSAERVLEDLYKKVQTEFAESYRAINRDDESKFSAAFKPDGGKLELEVDFYGRGEFPPGAYHSEGHQDGMGLCLYLALMRQLLGTEFRFAVLDDVVMSVDKQHRRELCAMLQDRYPETQFVITTHEEAWFHQMQKAGLVERGSAITFRSWSLETGPKTSQARDAWEEIANALEYEDVRAASGVLRHYLEFVSAELADSLCAEVQYRLDADHSLGELLPKATHRLTKLLGDGIKNAKKWGDAKSEGAISKRLVELKAAITKCNVENWMVNKAVHYNEWAKFSKEDFEPVVTSYKELLDRMLCNVCGEWLYVSPKGPSAEDLRCNCAKTLINIKKK